mmetsp:Transcript_50535/g.120260  ORF Transcript_50535/g.120260 Transcript_50535/m.120260 type:complete len:259 (+) Transcript_50535:367-1143(+)
MVGQQLLRAFENLEVVTLGVNFHEEHPLPCRDEVVELLDSHLDGGGVVGFPRDGEPVLLAPHVCCRLALPVQDRPLPVHVMHRHVDHEGRLPRVVGDGDVLEVDLVLHPSIFDRFSNPRRLGWCRFEGEDFVPRARHLDRLLPVVRPHIDHQARLVLAECLGHEPRLIRVVRAPHAGVRADRSQPGVVSWRVCADPPEHYEHDHRDVDPREEGCDGPCEQDLVRDRYPPRGLEGLPARGHLPPPHPVSSKVQTLPGLC